MARNWRQIEDSRNTRLWITSVAIPVVTIIASDPELRQKATAAIKTGTNFVAEQFGKGVAQVKTWFKNKKKKEETKDPCAECPVYGFCPTQCQYFASGSWRGRYDKETNNGRN